MSAGRHRATLDYMLTLMRERAVLDATAKSGEELRERERDINREVRWLRYDLRTMHAPWPATQAELFEEAS